MDSEQLIKFADVLEQTGSSDNDIRKQAEHVIHNGKFPLILYRA